MHFSLENFLTIFEIGGPVVAILVGISVITIAVILTKYFQLRWANLGDHRTLSLAISAWDAGDHKGAYQALARSKTYLSGFIEDAFDRPRSDHLAQRLVAEAQARLQPLERGFRFLEVVAQIAPLLGLFGTVLGMIEAFQALQAAGASVDPSLLAGGIWVALLTTATGLAVAMPTTLVLSWFESKIDQERVFIDRAIMTIAAPKSMGQ